LITVDNILMDREGNVALADFGKCVPYDGRPRGQCGHLLFRSPEMMLGDPMYGPKTDIWSLGMFIYIYLHYYFIF
jgi:serine/threonine protein kinase